MVKRVLSSTNLTRTGVSDWLVQRVSALIMAAYLIFMICYFAQHPQITYSDWQQLFAGTAMRVFSALTLLALLSHAWVGMWTIFTDYIKCPYTRGIVQILVILALIACLIWGIQILWSR